VVFPLFSVTRITVGCDIGGAIDPQDGVHAIICVYCRGLRGFAQQLSDLIEGFDTYCVAFDSASLFTGSSQYFHAKTLSLLRQHQSPVAALLDQSFLESLYATLTAWGMHRMGPPGAKLVEFNVMVESFRELEPLIESLALITMWRLSPEHIGAVGESIWEVISRRRSGVGATRIVSGSKALHHVLPDLVPAVDREYTIRFFLHNKNLSQGDEAARLEMFPHFHRIGTQCWDKIEARLGHGMNKSPTKVIDNAIVGFARTWLKG